MNPLLTKNVKKRCCDKSLREILLAKSSKKFKRTSVRKCFVLEIHTKRRKLVLKKNIFT